MLIGDRLEKSVVPKMIKVKIKSTVKVSMFLFLIIRFCDKI